MQRPGRLISAFVLPLMATLIVFGCGRSSVIGTYHQGNRSIEFRKDGKVFITDTGDVAEYSIDGKSIFISHIVGGAKGVIVSSTVVEFPPSHSTVGETFAGRWTRE